MRALAWNRSSLSARRCGGGTARSCRPEITGPAAPGAIVRHGEIAQCVGVFRHDAVVLRAFDGARHVERKELDQRPQSELREMQVGARPAARVAWRTRRARCNSFPRTAAAGPRPAARRVRSPARAQPTAGSAAPPRRWRRRCCTRSPPTESRASGMRHDHPASVATVRVNGGRSAINGARAEIMRSQGNHADQSSRSASPRWRISNESAPLQSRNRSPPPARRSPAQRFDFTARRRVTRRRAARSRAARPVGRMRARGRRHRPPHRDESRR